MLFLAGKGGRQGGNAPNAGGARGGRAALHGGGGGSDPWGVRDESSGHEYGSAASSLPSASLKQRPLVEQVSQRVESLYTRLGRMQTSQRRLVEKASAGYNNQQQQP